MNKSQNFTIFLLKEGFNAENALKEEHGLVLATTEARNLPNEAALETENPDIVSILVESGADVNARDEHGRTPLHAAAAKNQNPAVITTLVKSGTDVNARDKDGHTPLMAAAKFNKNQAVITVLLNNGADPKAVDIFEMTAWNYIQGNEHLKNTKAYWALNDAKYK